MESDIKNFEYEIKHFPKQKTLVVHTRCPVENLSQKIRESYGLIMTYLTEIGEQPIGMPFVVYHNLDMQDLEVEIGFPVSRIMEGKKSVQSGEIPDGNYAFTLYVGPYDKMETAYDGMNKWIEENEYEILGPVIEYYLNDPGEVGMENAKTEIRYRLKE